MCWGASPTGYARATCLDLRAPEGSLRRSSSGRGRDSRRDVDYASPVRSARVPSLVAFVAMTLSTRAAYAEWVARPNVDGVAVIDDGQAAGGVYGGVLFGYNAELEPVLLVPEVAGGFGYYAGEVTGIMGRALAGLRAGITASVEPALFAHFGYGYGVVTRGGVSHGEHGFAIRTGLSLDYRIERWITVGGELVYDVLLFSEGGVGALHSPGGGFTVAFWF